MQHNIKNLMQALQIPLGFLDPSLTVGLGLLLPGRLLLPSSWPILFWGSPMQLTQSCNALVAPQHNNEIDITKWLQDSRMEEHTQVLRPPCSAGTRISKAFLMLSKYMFYDAVSPQTTFANLNVEKICFWNNPLRLFPNIRQYFWISIYCRWENDFQITMYSNDLDKKM